MEFMHENLHAYQAALRFGEWAYAVCRTRAMIRKSLKDQLERATESILLNIAEGNGKTTRADRNRFFGYARASTFECAAIVDLLTLQGVITQSTSHQQKRTLQSVAAMLSGLMR